jgi:hypothetical protein
VIWAKLAIKGGKESLYCAYISYGYKRRYNLKRAIAVFPLGICIETAIILRLLIVLLIISHDFGHRFAG